MTDDPKAREKKREKRRAAARRDMKVRAGINRTGPREKSWNNLATLEALQHSREED